MFFQLLLLFYLSIFFSVGQCVTEDEQEKRIIGGNPAESPSQFPYIVAILRRKGDRVISKVCTGSILNENTILTAAHCCADVTKREAYVIAGVTDAFDLKSALIRRIKSCTPHPKYHESNWEPDDRANAHDVAVIKLVNTLPFSKHVAPITLISPNDQKPKTGISIGFGVTGLPPAENENSKLNYVETPIIDQNECRKLWGKVEGIFCSGEKFAASCWGDSGGPMVASINEQRFVMGVISMGPAVCGELPTVYTDMQHKSNADFIMKCMTEEC